MIQMHVSAVARELDARLRVIDIAGEVNLQAEQAVMGAFERACAGIPDASVVILNFSGLEYMNSAGIGLLVSLLIRARREGVRLAACCLNDHYREIFHLTRLDEHIAIFDDEAQSTRAFEHALIQG